MKKEKLTDETLHYKFVDICKAGDITNFKNLYNEYYVKNRSVFSSFLKIFNKKPSLDLDDINCRNSDILLMSAMAGQYEIVKEFFKDDAYVDKINKNGLLRKSLGGIMSPKRLAIKPVEYDIFKNINNFMYDALKDKRNFQLNLSTYFMDSCNHGDLNAIRYMIETPSLKKYLTFERQNMPSEYQLLKVSSVEVLNYLIIEHNMEQNKNFFEKILHTNDVLSIVEKKNLNYDLNDNLLVNKESSRSTKRTKL
jgi:hypothetical protein